MDIVEVIARAEAQGKPQPHPASPSEVITHQATYFKAVGAQPPLLLSKLLAVADGLLVNDLIIYGTQTRQSPEGRELLSLTDAWEQLGPQHGPDGQTLFVIGEDEGVLLAHDPAADTWLAVDRGDGSVRETYPDFDALLADRLGPSLAA
ncbi:hypothetical protein [Janibacter sp. GXQ6167]|uniref:hypothetical protein n=1 Tax=Janibacter sp. GXQ6167 TaxID=3240791 RepID=UPI003525A967